MWKELWSSWDIVLHGKPCVPSILVDSTSTCTTHQNTAILHGTSRWLWPMTKSSRRQSGKFSRPKCDCVVGSYIKSPIHGGADVDCTWLRPIEAWTLDLWVLPVVSRAPGHWEGTLWILSSLSCSPGHSWSAFTLWQGNFSSQSGT